MTRHITMLIAHPDDEVIFGFPVLQNAKKIICCSSDLNNPERQWCRNRKLALEEIGQKVGAEVICLDYNSEFYRLPTRNGSLMRLANDILSLLEPEEVLFTHNPWGEYGHLDHVLVHQVASLSGKRLLFSDISLEAGWIPSGKRLSLAKVVGLFHNDLLFYNECKAIYDHFGCWTWSKPPIKECMAMEI
jgi:hypothetical protein